jgi:hypothetical protein
MLKQLAFAAALALSVPALAGNLCVTLDTGGPFSKCATPSNSDITTKILPVYKPLCDAQQGALQVPPVTNYSCSNTEIFNYFSTNLLKGIQGFVESTLTANARNAVAPVTIAGFPP